MAVTERLMSVGQWSLSLIPDTPQTILDTLLLFGHVYVFDIRPRNGLSDATMKSLAAWGGIVRTRPTPYEIGGVNMAAWLGDEDGKGTILETAVTQTTKTFAQWVPFIIPTAAPNGPVPVTAGTITAVGVGTLTNTYQWVTPRQALDNLCQIFGGEWRVNKDATLDAGLSSALFVTTPTSVVMRRSSGRDQPITGISVTRLDLAVDAEEYVTKVIVKDASGAYTGAGGSAPPYKDLNGNALVIKKIVNSPETPAGSGGTQAAVLVAAQQTLRNQATLTSDEYDITRDVKAGDWIYVYDIESGFFDLTHQVRYRGSVIYPIALRILAVTWPVERGMGVWYRDLNGVWTDLTQFVIYEQPGASFEIGAINRPLTTS